MRGGREVEEAQPPGQSGRFIRACQNADNIWTVEEIRRNVDTRRVLRENAKDF